MTTTTTQPHKRIVIILIAVVLGMFAFGFALVPIYNVMCKTLGINGKTGGQTAISTSVDTSRLIHVRFITTNNDNLPWTFYPLTKTVTMHPGENTRVAFFARNNTDQAMTVQAIPSVAPNLSAKYLKKTECFCFTRQTLAAHQARDMPLLFHIDRNIPKDIDNITLAYTLFDVSKGNAPVISPVALGRLQSYNNAN